MELKQFNSFQELLQIRLLIVPYGIETGFINEHSEGAELLIVPYGIETRESQGSVLDGMNF